jgi:hypothetical protein
MKGKLVSRLRVRYQNVRTKRMITILKVTNMTRTTLRV